jgi:predicted ATPase
MALRTDDPLGFATAMLKRELADLARVPDDETWTIFDRGIGDSMGFLRLTGLAPSADLGRLGTTIGYSGPVFLAPPWRAIFRPDAERIQTWSDALASGEAVVSAWRAMGHEPIALPLASLDARADVVETMLAAK